mmetsp:Transcript_12268/g.28890  ORF Transcript_12268/g.28890 Transcript_12268/m.28890 type:complete len:257 (-) Transcript_12268:365-1135(-)
MLVRTFPPILRRRIALDTGCPPFWVGTTWVAEYPESITRQHWVSSFSHVSGTPSCDCDRYLMAAMQGLRTFATLPTPSSRNNTLSIPSDITEGTKGCSSSTNAQFPDEWALGGGAAASFGLARRDAASVARNDVPPRPLPATPTFIIGVGTTPRSSRARAQTLSWVSPSVTMPRSMGWFQESCPRFFIEVISSPASTASWCGGLAVALYMLDILLLSVGTDVEFFPPVCFGNTRPYLIIQPPLSTSKVGKSVGILR